MLTPVPLRFGSIRHPCLSKKPREQWLPSHRPEAHEGLRKHSHLHRYFQQPYIHISGSRPSVLKILEFHSASSLLFAAIAISPVHHGYQIDHERTLPALDLPMR